MRRVLPVCALLAAMGCGGGEKKKGPDEDGEAVRGPRGTLVFARGGDSKYLDPALVTDGESVKVCTNLFDTLIRFDNADRFINWCGERGVSLMLHGHKHVPHHIRAKMTVAGKEQEIMVVSCGSTMGAEHSPLCYDIVSWSKTTNKWNVVFYEDRSTSGFKPQEIELDLR